MLVDLVRVTTADGVQLDGILRRSSIASPQAANPDAFCLVHGTGGNFYSSSLFDVLTDKLLARGAAVLRVNTRGHDGISTAVAAKGGLRQGAAFERVDDCRHDLAAWVAFLRAEVGPRVALLGHSLGAVKCLYATAHDPLLRPDRLIAVSPPRLSYSWFCESSRRDDFLADYQRAEALVQAGRGSALLDVTVPLPFAIAAAGYLEKYGPEESYNYLRFTRSVDCSALFLFGSVEVEKNVAFQQAPDEIAGMAKKHPRFAVAMVEGGDHFYTGVREQAWRAIEKWLG